MRSLRILRRRFLGAGTAAFLSPFFAQMARAASPVRRLVLFNLGNGTVQEQFWPARQSDTSFTLSPILQPLAPLQDRAVVLQGFQFTSGIGEAGIGEAHGIGVTTALSGTRLDRSVKWSNNLPGRPGGPSLDQQLGAELGQGNQVPVLNIGVQSSAGDVPFPSWTADHGEVRDLQSPVQAWNRLFGVRGGITGVALDLDRSILDLAAADLMSLQAQLPAPERARLDGHLTAIRDVEKGIKMPFMGPPATAAPGCASATRPAADSLDLTADANFPTIAKLQMDVIAVALACDLTRVVSFNLGSPKSTTQYTWLGINDPYHNISHHLGGSQADFDRHAKIETWHATQLHYLADKLRGMPDGTGGDLLSATLVLWNNNLSRGEHTITPSIPYVLVGGDRAGVRPGRHLVFDRRAHNDLLLAVAQAVGSKMTAFGDPAFNGGPVSLS